MKRLALVFISIILIVSLAAPAGAVFALYDEMDPSSADVVEEHDLEEVAEEEVPPIGEAPQTDEALSGEDLEGEEAPSLLDMTQSPSDESSAPEGEMAETTPLRAAEGIVITQVASGARGEATHELIEIYNSSDSDIDVTGWCVRYASAKSQTFSKTLHCITPTSSTPGDRLFISARSYAVFATHEFRGHYGTAEEPFGVTAEFSGGMAGDAGRVAIFNQDALVDGVAWRKSPSTEVKRVEGEPTFSAAVIERRMSSDGIYQDTDDNRVDFIASDVRETYRYANFIEVFDACLNMADIQAVLPSGVYRDDKRGTCSSTPPSPVNVCVGVQISEVAANTSEQFVELYNSLDTEIALDGCQLQTNRNSKTYTFPDETIMAPGAFLSVPIKETELTLAKTTKGNVYVLSSDGAVEADGVSYENLPKESSWALVGEVWRQTYAVTPGEVNVYEKYLPCQKGYWRNEATGRCNKEVTPVVLADCGEGRERNLASGRCRNIPVASMLVPCREGQYRSEETNRCRSIALAVSSLRPCRDDQFRNPLTNRCKRIASTDDVALADCGEGRERNPVTSRCRNILASAPPAAGFAVEPVAETASVFVGWWALGAVALLAIGYAAWEWRAEVASAIRKVSRAVHSRK